MQSQITDIGTMKLHTGKCLSVFINICIHIITIVMSVEHWGVLYITAVRLMC